MIQFAVTGAGPFPLELLRAARCWPAGQADCAAIAESYRQPAAALTVMLESRETPTEQRILGYSWRLTE